MEYDGLDGFLGTRSALGYDIALAIELALIPLFLWNLHVLLVRRNYVVHKRVQLLLTAMFLVASICFVVAMINTDWQLRSGFSKPADIPRIVKMTYLLHVSSWFITAGWWLALVIGSANKFAKQPEPSDYGANYMFWILVLALLLFVTTLTGWEFYLLAFCF